MFKIFPLDFKEYPYIDIKIWEWCPAACTDCRFNINYIYKTKQFSLENILKRIKKVDSKFDKKFNLVFGNQDWLNHKNIIDILKAWLETWREVRLQIAFNIKKDHLILLKKIEEELWYDKIDIKIAQNAREINNNLLEKLLVLIKLLSNNTKFKIFIDLFLDFDKNSKLINFFSKNIKNRWIDNEFDFYVWEKVNIKLQNYSWKLDRKNKCINNLKRKSCQQLEQLYIKNWDIFLKDSIDIYDNWDLFIHDNLCNIGDIRISNLYLKDEEIYEHFNNYLLHLEKLKNKYNYQSDMCFDCITNWFKYKNI